MQCREGCGATMTASLAFVVVMTLTFLYNVAGG